MALVRAPGAVGPPVGREGLVRGGRVAPPQATPTARVLRVEVRNTATLVWLAAATVQLCLSSPHRCADVLVVQVGDLDLGGVGAHPVPVAMGIGEVVVAHAPPVQSICGHSYHNLWVWPLPTVHTAAHRPVEGPCLRRPLYGRVALPGVGGEVHRVAAPAVLPGAVPCLPALSSRPFFTCKIQVNLLVLPVAEIMEIYR
jgi:hypothetical protein